MCHNGSRKNMKEEMQVRLAVHRTDKFLTEVANSGKLKVERSQSIETQTINKSKKMEVAVRHHRAR